jgi:hypothetical protein
MFGTLQIRPGKIYFGWWMVAIGSAVRVLAGAIALVVSDIPIMLPLIRRWPESIGL